MSDVIDGAIIKSLLSYDPDTGVLTWINPAANHRELIGREAGWINSAGYREVRVLGRMYRAHRLAWLWMTGEWPAFHIDHANRVRSDNRWSNLRDATRLQQLGNTGPRSTNKGGHRGVYYFGGRNRRKSKPWRAVIVANGKRRYLGYFDTVEEAATAYDTAAREVYGEFYATDR